MKPHLPVRLLRAVVLMATAAPAALYAKYTAPTEIIVPDTYTNSVELSGTAEITSGTESTAHLVTGDVNIAINSMSTDYSYLYTSSSATDLGSLTFTKYLSVNSPDVTFDNLKDLTFKSKSSWEGGAVSVKGNLHFKNNAAITFNSNTAEISGGAAFVNGTTEFKNNANVSFNGNNAKSNGGAILVKYNDTITGQQLIVNENNNVTFHNNSAQGQGGCLGGALHISANIQLNHNGELSFSSNKAIGNYLGHGGAIYSNTRNNPATIDISYNDSLKFENNIAQSKNASYGAYGGAIVTTGTDLKLNSNINLLFSGNKALSSGAAEGGAIRIGYGGMLSIQNNGTAVFTDNKIKSGSTEKYNSIYVTDLEDLGLPYEGKYKTNVIISARKDGSVEFRDCAFIDVSHHEDSSFQLNSTYTGEDGKEIAQTGEIIFTGEYMTSGDKTSEFKGTASLHDGKLTVKNDAVLKAGTLVVTESVSGESIPTLEVNNATLTANKITLEADTKLTNTKGTISGVDDNSLLEIVGGKVENSGTISMNIAMESGELTATDGSTFAGITATEGVINIEGNVTIEGELTLGNATMVSLFTTTGTEGLVIVNLLDATSGINIENVDMLAVGDNVVFNVAVDSFDDLNSNNVLTIFSTENEEQINISQTITVTDKNNNIKEVTYTNNGDGSVTLSIPEPTTATLSLLALAALAARRRRK